MLADFENVISGNTQLLHKAVKQVEALINDDDHFVVVFNSTFGEPLVPLPRRATVRTTKQRVKPVESPAGGRPAPTVRFLSIGGKGHPLALTYELFRSVRELEEGILYMVLVYVSLPLIVWILSGGLRRRLSHRENAASPVIEIWRTSTPPPLPPGVFGDYCPPADDDEQSFDA